MTPEELLRSNLPDWAVVALEKDHKDTTTRGVAADWAEENDKDPLLVSCYRYMCLARKHPAVQKLSSNVDNLTTGYGWFADGFGSATSVVPPLLLPPKPIVLPNRRRRLAYSRWVWGEFWNAEVWFVNIWQAAPDEARQQLLEQSQQGPK